MDETGTNGSSKGRDGSRQPVHLPVLLRETLAILELRDGLVVVDGTVGAGGHSRAIVHAIGPSGWLVGLDRDSEILASARAALAEPVEATGAGARVSLHHLPHASMREALAGIGLFGCDRVLLDLGVSSLQLDRPERGFSFMADGPLDMRMDSSAPVTAADWLATVREEELADTLFQLGDERHSRRIAIRPSSGPGNRSQATCSPTAPHNAVTSSMETMVMAKPTLFMKASALPTRSGGQALDASAENCGESATTKNPQAKSSAKIKNSGRPSTSG